MPLLAPQRRSAWAVVLGGLACTLASFVLLQVCSRLPFLILARVLQGLAAAAMSSACSGMNANVQSTSLSWATPTVLQSAAMAISPTVAGFLHDRVGGERAVFFCAYAVIAVSSLIWLGAIMSAPKVEVTSSSGPQAREVGAVEQPSLAYGTMSSTARSGMDGYASISSSRSGSSVSSSRGSRRTSVSSTYSLIEEAGPVFGVRLFTALLGYAVIGFLTAALHSVVPLFTTRRFGWQKSAVGLAFVSMSAPALLISPLARMVISRLPKSARFLVTLGFTICVPAFLRLGRLEDSSAPSSSLLPILALISFGVGHCGDPLTKEVARLVAEYDEPASLTTALPSTAYAWGSLVGPLFAGAMQLAWDWQTMATSLGFASGLAALLTLVFLQGWIGHPRPIRHDGTSLRVSDEESAPLLSQPSQQETPRAPLFRGKGVTPAPQKDDFFDRPGNCAVTDESDFGSSVRTDGDRRIGKHRRHFSIDNFSIATTAVGPPADQDAPQVRFQAALETLAPMGSSFKQQLGNPERRFVMRETPHAPTTDPLLASGSRYVIDEAGEEGGKNKRHVVVFEEGTVPPELLERRQHHVVAINSVDGSVTLAPSVEDHAVHVTEETGSESPELPETCRRYVVVLLERGDRMDGSEDDSA